MRSTFLMLVALLSFGSAVPLRADPVNEVVLAQMKKKGIPGLSLAIIDGGKVVKEQGYGFTDKSAKTRVTASTLFQAGSVSKAVAASGALHLVEKGRLSLDEDVNARLRTWVVPQNEFTDVRKVTLRLLLSHTAGMTVHGFPGYAVGRPLPTLIQILNGEKPANTAPIRVDQVPGSQWRYSGGGYQVVQQLVIDVAGKPFPQFMDEAVFKPFGMASSTFSQPLPANAAVRAAKGYGGIFGQKVNGAWHVCPEMAAAGLWTTAGDLARFAIGLQNAVAGKATAVISQSLTQQMFTTQRNQVGLGVFLDGSGPNLRFGHDGVHAGYDASLKAYAHQGKGAAIMINQNDDFQATSQIFRVIAKEYQWPKDMAPKK